MRCPRCGTENRPQAKYCAQCRTPLVLPGGQPSYQPPPYAPPQPSYTPYPQPGYMPLAPVPVQPVPVQSAPQKRPPWLWIVVGIVLVAALLCLCLGCGGLTVVFGPDALKALATKTPTPTATTVSPSPAPPTITPSPPVIPPPPPPTAVPPLLPTSTQVPSTRTPTPTKPAAPVGLNIGNTAPDFALQDLDGKTVRLSDYRGRPVLLNFWGVWCGFCKKEMPDMQAVLDEYRDKGFVILAVDVGDMEEVARNYIQSNGFQFVVVMDSGKDVSKMYKVPGYPTSYFIDRNGVIRDKQVGMMERSRIEAGVAKIL